MQKIFYYAIQAFNLFIKLFSLHEFGMQVYLNGGRKLKLS